MAEDPPSRVDHNQVAEIVSSYLRHHQVEPDQLAGLIVEVHRALADLGRAPSAQQSLQPAVPIRRSLRQDYIVCLECGFRTQVLRRHLRVARGLDIADYRARWKLPLDYPLTASSYSARRSMMAKPDRFRAQTGDRGGAPADRRSTPQAAPRARRIAPRPDARSYNYTSIYPVRPVHVASWIEARTRELSLDEVERIVIVKYKSSRLRCS